METWEYHSELNYSMLVTRNESYKFIWGGAPTHLQMTDVCINIIRRAGQRQGLGSPFK